MKQAVTKRWREDRVRSLHWTTGYRTPLKDQNTEFHDCNVCFLMSFRGQLQSQRTCIGTFRTSTSRLQFAISLFRSASRIGNCCNHVTHGFSSSLIYNQGNSREDQTATTSQDRNTNNNNAKISLKHKSEREAYSFVRSSVVVAAIDIEPSLVFRLFTSPQRLFLLFQRILSL